MLPITVANVSKLDASRWVSEYGQAEGRRPMKILVVDNHFLIREALRSVLKELKNNATIVEAGDGHQAMRLVSEQPDIGLVLLELNLPNRDGFSVLSELRERHPAMSVIVFRPGRTATAWPGHWTSAPSGSFQSPSNARSF